MLTIDSKEYRKFKSGMPREEMHALFDQAHAARAAGDKSRELEFMKKVPLAPHLALSMKKLHGKKYVLDSGFNLTDAEAYFGKDWLDR